MIIMVQAFIYKMTEGVGGKSFVVVREGTVLYAYNTGAFCECSGTFWSTWHASVLSGNTECDITCLDFKLFLMNSEALLLKLLLKD